MFKPEEYQQRLDRLQVKVMQAGLDALLIATDPNVMYLTGVDVHSMERPVLIVVPQVGEPTLIVPRMEQEPLSRAAINVELMVYWEVNAKPERCWEEALYQALGTAKRIGIDPSAELAIVDALRDYQWETSELVEDLRVIKSPAEIALTKRAANYWTQSMNAMLEVARAGTPISELMAVGGEVATTVFTNEPDANWINTRVVQFFQCSPASGSPHHFSYRADERLPHGPTIINAVGAVCQYNAENERTILTGDYTSEHAELFDLTYQGHQLALSLIKPGVPCAEVDCAVQAFFEQAGVTDKLRCRTGHGFGLLPHERPFTSEGSEEVYRSNMIISIEPGLYVDGVGGFRHSDTVLITDEGIEVLTSGTPIDRASLSF